MISTRHPLSEPPEKNQHAFIKAFPGDVELPLQVPVSRCFRVETVTSRELLHGKDEENYYSNILGLDFSSVVFEIL